MREADEGGDVAWAIGESIFVEADDEKELEREILDPIECHFGGMALALSTPYWLMRADAEVP